MQNNTNKPLIEPNPYPTLQEQNDIVVGLTGQNTYNTYQNNPYALNQPNQPIPQSQPYVTNQQKPAPYQVPIYNQQQPYQGFQPISQPPQNQGFQPVGPGPYRPPPPQNQGFQPVGPGQYRPPPPPPQQYQQAVVIQLPSHITAHHPQYQFITQQCSMPCQICHYRGVDFISLTPGCTAYSWSVCLFLFTGICCFWIPFVTDSCKDIKISCSKCGRTKCIIQKPCC